MQEMTPEQEMNFQREILDKQQNAEPNSVYADNLREDKMKNIIAQLNPELLLSEIEHRIRGEKKVYAGGMAIGWEPINKGGKLISENLVQNYISFLNVYLTQNNSLSNFSPSEINNIMDVVIGYVRDDLSDNAEDYGLTTKNEITKDVTVKLMLPYTDKDGITSMKETPMPATQIIAIGEEITNYDEFTKIGHIICQSTFSVLKQAQNGMLAGRIFKALRVNETLNGGAQKSKWDFLKFW
jgi:hypothetical protein